MKIRLRPKDSAKQLLMLRRRRRMTLPPPQLLLRPRKSDWIKKRLRLMPRLLLTRQPLIKPPQMLLQLKLRLKKSDRRKRLPMPLQLRLKEKDRRRRLLMPPQLRLLLP